MTSSNGNIFRVIGHLCEEFIGDRWIPPTKAIDAELWCFLWSKPEKNGWVNNRDAGDLRRHRAQYGVTVMTRPQKLYISVHIICKLELSGRRLATLEWLRIFFFQNECLNQSVLRWRRRVSSQHCACWWLVLLHQGISGYTILRPMSVNSMNVKFSTHDATDLALMLFSRLF